MSQLPITVPRPPEHSLHDRLLVDRQVQCHPHLASALGVGLAPTGLSGRMSTWSAHWPPRMM